MLKKSAIWLNRILWTLIVSCLLVVASYVSLGRYYIGYVEKYQKEIISQFVEFTGMPVEVGELSASWSTLSFILSFDNVILNDENNNILLMLLINYQLHQDQNPFLSQILQY